MLGQRRNIANRGAKWVGANELYQQSLHPAVSPLQQRWERGLSPGQLLLGRNVHQISSVRSEVSWCKSGRPLAALRQVAHLRGVLPPTILYGSSENPASPLLHRPLQRQDWSYLPALQAWKWRQGQNVKITKGDEAGDGRLLGVPAGGLTRFHGPSEKIHEV